MAEIAEYDAVIIGAGITGLSCAYRIAKDRSKVLLIEPLRPGGLISTSHLEGFTLEKGPNVLVEKPAIKALLEEIGLQDQVVYPAVRDYRQLVLFRDKMQPVKRGLFGMLQSPLFPLADKIRMPLRIFAKGLIDNREDMPIDEFYSKVVGKAAVDNIINPVLLGIYGGDISRLSVRSLFPGLWKFLSDGGSVFGFMRSRSGSGRPKIFVLRNGMRSLVSKLLEAIGSKATINQSAVTSIVKQNDDKHFFVKLSDSSEIKTKEVYVTTAGAASASYLRDLSPQLCEKLDKLRFAGLVVVHCAVSKDIELPADAFGILIPSHAGRAILGIMYNSTLFPHMSPAAEHLLTICLGGINSGDLMQKTDSEIYKIVFEEAAQLPAPLTKLRFLSIARWPAAIPQYEVGHSNLVAEMREAEKNYPGLHFIGADQNGIGVPDRVQAGIFE